MTTDWRDLGDYAVDHKRVRGILAAIEDAAIDAWLASPEALVDLARALSYSEDAGITWEEKATSLLSILVALRSADEVSGDEVAAASGGATTWRDEA